MLIDLCPRLVKLRELVRTHFVRQETGQDGIEICPCGRRWQPSSLAHRPGRSGRTYLGSPLRVEVCDEIVASQICQPFRPILCL